MHQALELASDGIALASPNPCVGAVVVAANGEIVGRGTHTYCGEERTLRYWRSRRRDAARVARLST